MDAAQATDFAGNTGEILDKRLGDINRLAQLEHLYLQDRTDRPDLSRICSIALSGLNGDLCDISIIDNTSFFSIANAGDQLPDCPLQHSIPYRVLELHRLVNSAECDGLNDLEQWQTLCSEGYTHLAAAPLLTADNLLIGCLTVGRCSGGAFTPREVETVIELARLSVDWLDANRVQRVLQQRREIARMQADLLKSQQRRIARNSRILEQILKMAQIGGWEYEVDNGRLIWTNELFDIHGIAHDREIDLDFALSFFPKEYAFKVSQAIHNAVIRGQAFELDCPFKPHAGNVRWVRLIADVERNSDGRIYRVIGALQDISQQVAREEQIRHIGHHDALTGLPNRVSFTANLEDALQIADKQNGNLALMLIDIDNFKTINDTFGHDIGDDVLVEFSKRLRSGLREQDMVFRLGGDEFAVIIPAIRSREQMEEIADRLQRNICHAFAYKKEAIPLSASIGIAVFPDDTRDPTDLLKKTDIALYDAKYAGRACFSFFHNMMERKIAARHETLKNIAIAIDNKELVPFFQPIVSAGDGQVQGFEALVRWVRETGSVFPPAYFQDALDDPKTSRAIGRLMRDSILKKMVDWTGGGIDFGYITLNVAAHELQDGQFARTLIDAIDTHGIDRSRLAVEITEGVLLSQHSQHVAGELKLLADNGILIALDDFGTGYAALSHLKQFHVDVLKIDRSFVSNLPEDNDSLSIVKAIIGLANNLERRVIAEGVETSEQAQLLARLGCDCLQGYLYCKPVPGDEVPAVIERLTPIQNQAVNQ